MREREVSLKDKVEISGKEKIIPVSAKRGYCESRNRFLFVCMFVLFNFFCHCCFRKEEIWEGSQKPRDGLYIPEWVLLLHAQSVQLIYSYGPGEWNRQ